MLYVKIIPGIAHRKRLIIYFLFECVSIYIHFVIYYQNLYAHVTKNVMFTEGSKSLLLIYIYIHTHTHTHTHTFS